MRCRDCGFETCDCLQGEGICEACLERRRKVREVNWKDVPYDAETLELHRKFEEFLRKHRPEAIRAALEKMGEERR